MRQVLESICANPLFGILLTVAAYELAVALYKKVPFVLFNPLLVSIVLVCTVLIVFDIDYETYNLGGEIITLFVSPITIILAVPLYLQIHVLRKNGPVILTGIFLGCVTAVTTMCGFALAFGMDRALFASLVPKSITTAIAVELSAGFGGIPAITVIAVLVAGLTGVILAPALAKAFHIRDEVALGLAIGTCSHALGTSKALELGETQGAMSSLAIGIAGIITTLISPWLVRIIMGIWL